MKRRLANLNSPPLPESSLQAEILLVTTGQSTSLMEITVNDLIASTELDWISPDGTKTRIVAGVGTPFEGDRCWRCPVTLDGLHQELPSIAGEDSLQAIALALAFINTRLRHLLEDGGRLAIPEDGGDFPIEAYFRPWNPRD